SYHSSYLLFLLHHPDHPDLHSFPTRRSSDLVAGPAVSVGRWLAGVTTVGGELADAARAVTDVAGITLRRGDALHAAVVHADVTRSEEHTSELQSRFDLVCRLLLEKKKNFKH